MISTDPALLGHCPGRTWLAKVRRAHPALLKGWLPERSGNLPLTVRQPPGPDVPQTFA